MNSATRSYCSKTKMSDPIYKTSLKRSFNHIQNKSIDDDNSLRTRPLFFKDFHLALTNIFLLHWRQHTYIHHHKLFFFLQLFHSQFLHFIVLLHSCYFKFFILKLNLDLKKKKKNYKTQTILLVSQGLKLFWFLTNRVYCTRFCYCASSWGGQCVHVGPEIEFIGLVLV